MRARSLALILALGLSLALAGCGDEGTVPDPGSATGPLDGTTYLATSATEDGAERPFVEGSEVRLTFGGGRLGIQAGCNTMSGGYTVDGDTLTVEPMAGTEMGCDQPLMDQDAWLAGLFAEPVTFARTDETLTITAGTTILELTDREIAAPDAALTGTTWQLETLIEGSGPDGSASSVPEGTEASLLIDGDGNVQVHTGCNTGRTTAKIGPSAVTFGPMALTRMACPDDASRSVENAIVAVLDGEAEFEIIERQLTLTAGEQALQWRAGD